MSAAFLAILKRDLLLLARHKMDVLNPLLFGFLVALLFPLGLGPEANTLSLLAPGLLWVIALLACLWAVDGLFDEDYHDGSLALMLLADQPLYFLVLARLIVQWLASGFAIAMVSPVLALMLYLPVDALGAMFFSVLIGSLALVCIGAIGAALTVSIQNGGVLLSLIVLPLYVPILIFGAASVQSAVEGTFNLAYLAIIAAIMLFALVLSPLAIGAALRINVDAS